MAVTRVATFASLVEGYQHTDPKLYQILQGFVQALGEVQAEIDPAVKRIIETTGTIGAPSTAPTTIAYEIISKQILRIFWSGATNAASYEIRRGSFWDTATYVTGTSQTEVRLDPILIGSYTYLVRAKNGLGIYSDTYNSILITIPPLGSISVSAQVVDNNVLLRYSRPTSTWLIHHYDIFRNNVLIGSISAEFFTWFESVAGTFIYGVEAVDIAGNRSLRGSTSADVNQPPDFELLDSRASLLSGSRVNALIVGAPELGWDYTDTGGWQTTDYLWFGSNTGQLMVCVDTSKNYGQHFTTRSWDQPSDQTAAGYPIYLQPAATTAQYQETTDYGGTFNGVILNLSWLLQQQSSFGVVSVASLVEFSVDGLTWTTPVSGPSAFGASFRYTRLTFNFTANNDKAIAIFSNLVVSLDVKYQLDSGDVNVLASDVGGTVVTFNRPFKDIESITITPTKQPEPLMAIYDFVDIPNPVSFKILVYNSIGYRVDALVSWKARGVV